MSYTYPEILSQRQQRAAAIAAAGGLPAALQQGRLAPCADLTVSEALVLGLLRQGVTQFLGVLGHGTTEVGEVLRVYQQAGLVRLHNLRSEIEASHAAAALRWISGEKAAVITSIGPGALQALAASLVPASDGIGVWYLFGDETTQDEGPNMQQIPLPAQASFLKLCAAMGAAYQLHTPLALPTALQRGLLTVDHPHRPGPFFLLLPMNVQPALLEGFNLHELPAGPLPPLGPAAPDLITQAASLLYSAPRIIIKLGGGARAAGPEIVELAELIDAVIVANPIASGVVPYSHPLYLTVGGSKGSLSGNYAMQNAGLLLAVGTRAVCQSDCSRTGYPNVRQVINLNTDLAAAAHYNNTLALLGDAVPTLRMLIAALKQAGAKPRSQPSPWQAACAQKRHEWQAFKARRYACPTLYDPLWQSEVLTQPAAIKTALDWAQANDAVSLFDAGDVQANGFQIVEDQHPGQTFTETGASYMGFGVSALLATGLARQPFYGLALTGDGSFTMSPQVLIDGVEHGARGCILLLDNRRMAAISGLQMAQYGAEFATADRVQVDYVAWARSVYGVLGLDGGRSPQTLLAALSQARAHPGLSLVHVPVYYGPHELGGMGVFGRWNVGNWCEDTQALRHQIGL